MALVRLVQRIMDAEYQSEAEGDALLLELERSVVDPQVSDLIFWPARHPRGKGRELTADEVVDIALAYKPIELGPASG